MPTMTEICRIVHASRRIALTRSSACYPYLEVVIHGGLLEALTNKVAFVARVSKCIDVGIAKAFTSDDTAFITGERIVAWGRWR